ncbi:DUF2812 domain-containing protein [Desulfosporosinus sp.]|uniref:DUF2812 domain-containing protein n=1 Tax=Desulfosporosinus sp. TaxID=157907 RepID=UPI00269A7DDA|nr:DUF2812 domain-containing protein [Desulfosporosinus sp.]
MRKFKYFIDYDKEEKWLTEMAKKGYQLIDTSFGYKFRFTKPEEATIKIDYRTFKHQEDFIDYCTLFEDSGWQHIVGKKNSGPQYFKKIDKDSDDDIFSDKISKAGKYKRLSKMFIELAICFLPLFVAMIATEVIDLDIILNPKLLYLTPQLWDMNGELFWKAFIFETPFALLRALGSLFIPLCIASFLFISYRAQKLYKKNTN